MPFFSKEQPIVKPKERKFIKIEAPFVDGMSGLAIVKMLDSKEQCTDSDTEAKICEKISIIGCHK